ncbi:triose-phosphate isomerase [Luteithermobacter gelatinilyticus]|uniref:triose-phosphate isomerase n=1 Tax=Luteithermobacter gelatinilyticus TaxID=2582913 RepID=UPI001105A6D8|nr:triose-phosphate isomerase [Luteithermobacter gelatinilyticus]
MAAPKALVAGNWKMNGLKASVQEIEDLQKLISEKNVHCDVLVCPPATLLAHAIEATKGSSIAIGGQDCHTARAGAHTGDISAEMLKDLGCSHVIVGHSERRSDHGEDNDMVRAKASAAQREGLVAIICVGETEAERDNGQTLAVVTEQVVASLPEEAEAINTIIAYEPVWAIGTGKTPTAADVAEVHAAIRSVLKERFGESGDEVRILYGGSVKPDNAAELMAVENVNGALVGGASLKAESFYGILQAYG